MTLSSTKSEKKGKNCSFDRSIRANKQVTVQDGWDTSTHFGRRIIK